MNAHIATAAYLFGIMVLFWLDRDRSVRTSKALWIPVIWLVITASRPLSVWLQTGPTVAQAQQYIEGSPLDAFVYTVLSAVGTAVLFKRGQRVRALLQQNVPVLLFFFYCLLSILWSDYPFVTLKHWIKGVSDVVMVLVVLTDFEPEAAFKRALTRVGFLVLPLSVLFIKYYPDLGRSYNPWNWIAMYCGVTTTKNELGMICLVFGLVSLWCFLEAFDKKGSERTRRLIAHGTILGMVGWLFWMANSVTSQSCFILAGGLIVATKLFRLARKPAVVHFLVAMSVALALFALFFDSGGGLVESLGRDSSLTGRTDIWHAVLSVVQNPLIGTGYESFWLGDRLQKVWLTIPGIQEAHDGYLEIYLNLGWVGVALLIGIIIAGYRKVMKLFRNDPDAGRIRLAFFVVGVIYNFTEAGFRMMSITWILFLMATMNSTYAVAPELTVRKGSGRVANKAEKWKLQPDEALVAGRQRQLTPSNLSHRKNIGTVTS